MAWVLFFEILAVCCGAAVIWGTFRGVKSSLQTMAEAIVDHSKAHNGRTDDALRQIEELQALAGKQDKWATVTNIRLDTLELLHERANVLEGRVNEIAPWLPAIESAPIRIDGLSDRLDTLEAYVHQPPKPAGPPRRVIQPSTASEFRRIIENGVDE